MSRYGRADTSFGLDRRDQSQPVDLDLGTRRARAAALLTMALPGSVYVYQSSTAARCGSAAPSPPSAPPAG